MSIPLPKAFQERIINEGFPNPQLINALDTTSPTSIRINPFKTKPEFNLDRKISWCENAYYLEKRPSFTLDPLFHAGCYYPQEAGSMLLDLVIRNISLPEEPNVLDLCAAPGGKSTLLATFLNNKGCLVSNEIIHQRAWILRENISKAGFSNTFVSNNAPSAFRKLSDFFDLIIVDAPCSGEGMFRKDPNARLEWSEQNVLLCANRQHEIIEDVWDSLRIDGYLIYSTCTFNADENEENVKWMLEEFDCELVKIPFPLEIPLGRENIGWYGIPGITETEGFYIVILRKLSSCNSPYKKVKKNVFHITDSVETSKLIEVPKGSKVLSKGEELYLVPESLAEQIEVLNANLNLYKICTHIGTVSKKGIIPHEDLALNFSLSFRTSIVNLEKHEALKYLHGDTFPLKAEQGYNLMSYQGAYLGWIKQIGNRFNNYYPKQWRIRMNVE